MNKGGFSFVAMLVINPIVILFYQNCSMAPLSYAKNPTPSVVTRGIASEGKPVMAELKQSPCADGKKSCLKAE